MTSVFEGQPFKTRPFLSKTRVMKGFHPITPLNPPENQVSQTLLEGLQIITLKGSKVNKHARKCHGESTWMSQEASKWFVNWVITY